MFDRIFKPNVTDAPPTPAAPTETGLAHRFPTVVAAPTERADLETKIAQSEAEETEAKIAAIESVQAQKARLLAELAVLDERTASLQSEAVERARTEEYEKRFAQKLDSMETKAIEAIQCVAEAEALLIAANTAAQTLRRVVAQIPKIAVRLDESQWGYNNAKSEYSQVERLAMQQEITARVGTLTALSTQIEAGFSGTFWVGLDETAREMLTAILQLPDSVYDLEHLMRATSSAVASDWQKVAEKPKPARKISTANPLNNGQPGIAENTGLIIF
jgi:hypothetical protein